ncbi:hypothetical protein [Alteraurantiacibacter aquimixticola]|uniref:Uncharacterized protein n=1 Tax=Alteraurantiacibacter aquimixticola TaxID=2489173 RepID=A0A4T3F518_9SPHN|nr:hypothetical protein [Alteraurantiacibacter aquimixticola]TIX50608.1 hypothetical protein E5222_10120 [Alteraurantiacibacter aquimixticola]
MALAVLVLAACGEEAPAPQQRVDLGEPRPAAPEVMAVSPDTSEATWSVDEDGQSIEFGNLGEGPLLTLACRLGGEEPQMAVIRHAAARPGLSALFPVIGNGMRSRFMVDAVLEENEWRWEGVLPADDPQLDVFTGTRALTATLPGRGMLEIRGSRIPGEFVTWCRAGGETVAVEAEEGEDAE